MPSLDHWPLRPDHYRPEDSQVLRFLVENFDTTLEDADKIFHAAASKGVVTFNPTTRLWCGTKGGRR
ncbi:MAG: hypothetical protein WCK77_25275 [Verrucomicrobiota bacterium]